MPVNQIPTNYELDKRLNKLELIVERQSAIVSRLMWIAVASAASLIVTSMPTIISGLVNAASKGS